MENEQKGFCAYTEIKIQGSRNCHIDHFHTRNLFPTETFAYNNLLVSCNSEEYGAKYKDKQIRSKADYDFLMVNRRKKAIINLNSMKDALTEDELVAAIGEFETMIRQLYRQG